MLTVFRALIALGALCSLGSHPAARFVQASNMRLEPWPDAVVEQAESLPVQEGGRVKPLHTFASFTLLRMTGRRSLETPHGERLTAVEWLLDTLFFSEASADYPVFLVQDSQVVEAIGVGLEGKRRRDRYSFNELRGGTDRLFQQAREIAAIEEKNRTSVQQQLFLLANNVIAFRQLSDTLDFARTPIPFGPDETLTAILGDAESVSASELLHRSEALGRRFEELIADHTTGGGEALQTVSSLLNEAAARFASSDYLAFLPPAADSDSEEWFTPYRLFVSSFPGATAAATTPEHVAMVAGLEELVRTRNQPEAFKAALAELHTTVVESAQARGEYDKIGLEVGYYKSKVVARSLYVFLLAFVVMAFMWLRPKSAWLRRATTALVGLATLLLCAAIVMRCMIRGRPPVSTLYETVLFVTAVGAIVGLVMELINRQRLAVSAAAILGVIGLFVANGYEMLDKRDTMPSLVAVLDTNFWLATHVTAITIGYSAGMLAALMASVYLLTKAVGWKRAERSFHRNLGRMVYGVLCFGLIFSTVGTILGGIWANDSWGRFWGWDPKENGAMLIVLSQILILHGRMGGYLREHGVCMAAAFGGTIVAFSWWGVNLLGVGLHSYGFTSGISRALWTYYWIQWGIVGVGAITVLRSESRHTASTRGAHGTSAERLSGGEVPSA